MSRRKVGGEYPQFEDVKVAAEIDGYKVSDAYLDERTFGAPAVVVNVVCPVMDMDASRVWIVNWDVRGEKTAAEQEIGFKPEIEAGQGNGSGFTLPRAVIDKALELLPSPIDS